MTDGNPDALRSGPFAGWTGPERGAAWFVWGCWAALTLGALTFVGLYGCNVPFCDEWLTVPILTGTERPNFEYFWGLHNEHRIPLPKLLLLGLGKLTHGDSRAGMFFNVCALAGLAFASIRAMKRLRGRTAYADAFFPVALLHFGHWENLLWNFQVQFVLSTVLAGFLLLAILHGGERLSFGKALGSGLCLVSLPLCGANGLPFVLPLAVWMLCRGIGQWRSGHPGGKRNALVLGIFGLAGPALVGLYYLHYNHQHGLSFHARTLAEGLRGGLMCLAVSGGPAAQALWPYSGWLVVGFLIVGAVSLASGWRCQSEDRLRRLGLGLFLVAVLGLVFGLSWGRAAVESMICFTSRYGTLTVLALCWAYVAWEVGGARRWGSWVSMGLYTLVGSLLVLNGQAGLENARQRRQQYLAVVRDLRDGLPATVVAQNHLYLNADREDLIRKMEQLRQGGFGKFKLMAAPPAVREVPLAVKPTWMNQIIWKDGISLCTGAQPVLLFHLPEPRLVYAFRLRYSYPGLQDPRIPFKLAWKRGAQGFSEAERVAHLSLEGKPGEQTVDVYVQDVIDEFVIQPETKPCTFQLQGITLLIPQAHESGPPAMAFHQVPDR